MFGELAQLVEKLELVASSFAKIRKGNHTPYGSPELFNWGEGNLPLTVQEEVSGALVCWSWSGELEVSRLLLGVGIRPVPPTATVAHATQSLSFKSAPTYPKQYQLPRREPFRLITTCLGGGRPRPSQKPRRACANDRALGGLWSIIP